MNDRTRQLKPSIKELSSNLSTPPAASSDVKFRSGAVARLASMPVATLRIWEQRYQAVQPKTTSSKHRLYDALDVQRVLLLRKLTQRGYAIGSIAHLNLQQLQVILQNLDCLNNSKPDSPTQADATLRLVVVGPTLALRLQRPALAHLLGQGLHVVCVFDSLSQAIQVAPSIISDVLLWHAPELSDPVPAALAELALAQQACNAHKAAVLYRFATSGATKALHKQGASVLREPIDDQSLVTWLDSIRVKATHNSTLDKPVLNPLSPAACALAPRRFDDKTLTAIAGMTTSLACECPAHIAELLMLLSSFETYSATCAKSNPLDEHLHNQLQHIAGTSRTLFEAALERVALIEGISLDP